uniref:Uncharacterized protein n=1 Tax=Vibrio cholerae Mex1 TaxID=663913 RepID=C9E5I3_VIBCL|nr:hypothetical protein ICEVCHMEX1_0044 [Vibrio cholerae Mex1]
MSAPVYFGADIALDVALYVVKGTFLRTIYGFASFELSSLANDFLYVR